MDGLKSLSLENYRSFCGLSRVSTLLRDFLAEQGVFERYYDIWQTVSSGLLGDCFNKWSKVGDKDKGKAFDLMVDSWPSWMVVDRFARRFGPDPTDLCAALASSRYSKVVGAKRTVTIGVYYHTETGDGTSLVMRQLIRLWQSMGYRIVLLTDVQGPSDMSQEVEDIAYRALPNEGTSGVRAYLNRAKDLHEIVESERIDLVVYHAWNTSLLPWDMLVFKTMNVPVIVHCHSIFTVRLLRGDAFFKAVPNIMRLADGIVCLNKVDSAFWSKFNSNVSVVYNPVRADVLNASPSSVSSHDVLWVGRLSDSKRPDEAIRVFSRVHAMVPDARLLMVGQIPSEETRNRLEKLAEYYQIEELVSFLDHQDEVVSLYQSCSVLLVTSEYEGYSLPMAEALLLGVPIVSYSLPYLSMVQDNEAVMQVPFGNQDAAAEAVTTVLLDDALRADLVAKALDYSRRLREYDYRKVWDEIISSVEHEGAASKENYYEELMWQTMCSHYAQGVKRLKDAATSKNQSNGYREVERIHSSASYKIGRFVTWPARKIRTFLTCIKEHGMAYTFDVYLRRDA